MCDTEIFIDIKGYKGLYQVSNRGRVKAIDPKRTGYWYGILDTDSTPQGYRTVYLRKDGKGAYFRVDHLVAAAFVPNPLGKLDVRHKDGRNWYDSEWNLEWCDKTVIKHSEPRVLW